MPEVIARLLHPPVSAVAPPRRASHELMALRVLLFVEVDFTLDKQLVPLRIAHILEHSAITLLRVEFWHVLAAEDERVRVVRLQDVFCPILLHLEPHVRKQEGEPPQPVGHEAIRELAETLPDTRVQFPVVMFLEYVETAG